MQKKYDALKAEEEEMSEFDLAKRKEKEFKDKKEVEEPEENIPAGKTYVAQPKAKKEKKEEVEVKEKVKKQEKKQEQEEVKEEKEREHGSDSESDEDETENPQQKNEKKFQPGYSPNQVYAKHKKNVPNFDAIKN